tara:strand:- start:5457 stop:6656 length:1200 start_codon:yes stop_codon:yes gene_type:complete
MGKFFNNFLKTNYFKSYLIFIFLFSILFLSQKFLYPTDWTTSEWLINYEGGFVRRGLIGEVLLNIHNLSDITLRYLVFYFEILILLIFLFLIYKFLQNIYLNQFLIFLFFCPIFLIYPLAENEVLVRKEYLLLSIYIFYLILLLKNNYSFFLIILILLPVMNLIWDGMIFYIIFFIFAFLCKKNLKKKEIIYFILSFLPYLISLFFVIIAKSDPNGFEKMCISLNENCFGAMYALDKTLLWNIEYVTSRFKLEYLITHLIIIIFCFTPTILYSYFDDFKFNIGIFSVKKILLKLNLLLIFSMFLFMLIGYDWGRWINIGYSFSILTLFFLIKNSNIDFYSNKISLFFDKFSINNRKIFYFLFFCYTFTWNMKVIMTDDIGSFPYYRIITKSLKIVSSYI